MKRRAKLEICHNSRGKQRWWYHVKGANGELMVVSEKFGSRADAKRQASRFFEVMQGMGMNDWVGFF